jgi:hypothetical protein
MIGGLAFPPCQEALKTAAIGFRHAPRCEPSLEGGPHAAPVERGDALDRVHRFGFAIRQ